MTLCVRCKQRESTGIMIMLCDECFDQFEKECDKVKTEKDLPSDFAKCLSPDLQPSGKRNNDPLPNS